MHDQYCNPKKVFFADSEEMWKRWEKTKNKDDMIVIIRNDGEIDRYKLTKNDKAKEYLLLGLVVSCVIVISYLCTYSINEFFMGAEAIFSFCYQVSIAYLVSVLFYYITVIRPQKARRDRTRVLINNRLGQIVYDMSMITKEFQNVTGIEGKILDFNTLSGVIDRKTINNDNTQYLSLGDYVIIATAKIREDCKSLLDMFYLDLSVDAIVTINCVMNAYINREEFSDTIRDLRCFEVAGDDIFEEYRQIIKKVEDCRIK